MADVLIVQSKVKAQAKQIGMAFGADAVDELSNTVEQLIKRAAERAKQNGRKTIKGRDI